MRTQTKRSSRALTTARDAGPIVMVTIRTPSLTDTLTAAAVGQEIRSLIEPYPVRNVLLDCREVEHMSVSFLGELKNLEEEIEWKGGTLHCCGIKKEVCLVLEALGLGHLYAGHNPEHALARCLASLQKKNGTRPVMAQ